MHLELFGNKVTQRRLCHGFPKIPTDALSRHIGNFSEVTIQRYPEHPQYSCFGLKFVATLQF